MSLSTAEFTLQPLSGYIKYGDSPQCGEMSKGSLVKGDSPRCGEMSRSDKRGRAPVRSWTRVHERTEGFNRLPCKGSWLRTKWV